MKTHCDKHNLPILKEFNQHKCYRCLYSDNEYRKSLIKDLKDKLDRLKGELITAEKTVSDMKNGW